VSPRLCDLSRCRWRVGPSSSRALHGHSHRERGRERRDGDLKEAREAGWKEILREPLGKAP